MKLQLKEGEYIKIPAGKMSEAMAVIDGLETMANNNFKNDVYVWPSPYGFSWTFSWTANAEWFIKNKLPCKEVEWQMPPNDTAGIFTPPPSGNITKNPEFLPASDWKINCTTQALERNVGRPLEKDQTMPLSNSEVQEIVNRVSAVMKNAASHSTTRKPTLTSRLSSFAWGATKRTLLYCFAPAARWIQNIVFIASVAGVGIGGYKAYDWAKENITLPTITWEQPNADGVSE